MSLGSFVQSGLSIETDNHQTRILSGMWPAFGNCTAEMLEVAKKNLRLHFAVVGLTEYFEQSMVLMRKTLGWNIPFHLSLIRKAFGGSSQFYEKTNVSINRPQKEDLSEDDLNTIKKFNELDLKLYSHVEELFYK